MPKPRSTWATNATTRVTEIAPPLRIDRVLAAQPAHADALTGRAFAQALRGDLAGAIGALETITANHPARAPAWQTLGAVRNWAWDHTGAEVAFKHALRLTPANADAQFGIASTLLARGDFAAGWPAFERRPDHGGEAGSALARIPIWDGAPFRRDARRLRRTGLR
jgi:predicted Zn-dependent protease